MAEFVIDEVTDLDEVWPKIEVLIKGLIEYHRRWDQRALNEGWSQWIRDYMRSQTTLLASDPDGLPIAFVSGGVTHEANVFNEAYGHLDNVFVVEAWRKSGVGSELVRRFEAWCLAGGATEMRLEVTAGNELGLAFWTRKGYGPMAAQLRKPLGAAI